MKILIVGAGIGGLTLAAFLKDSDIDFEIIEKATSWSKQGFSLGLWNNGRDILKKLGLADKFDEEGSRIRHYKICDGRGRVLRTYDLSEFYSEYGLAYTHISRVSLHEWLLNLVGESKIRLGLSVGAIRQTGSEVEVEFSDGATAKYDFVIGTDGIHSDVRNLVFSNHCESFDNWRVWYAWVGNENKQKATVTEYVEAGEFIGVFDVHDKTLAVLIAPASHSVWDDPAGRLERLRKVFKDEACSDELLSGLTDQDIVPTDLSCVKVKKWVSGRVVLTGDAAHGFEPHAGLGASMAMEDSYVLAAELMKISPQYSFQEAFKNYERTRRRRVAIARRLTNRMRAWAFIKSKFLRKVVNLAIPFIPQSFFVNDYHKLLREEI